jgi:hypothetical protein
MEEEYIDSENQYDEDCFHFQEYNTEQTEHHEEEDSINDEQLPFSEENEENYQMSKIEEANEDNYEESIECSKMDSPERKMNIDPHVLVDSQVFDLKLSKIQKIGEEHRFIESDHLNFTSNETGNKHFLFRDFFT